MLFRFRFSLLGFFLLLASCCAASEGNIKSASALHKKMVAIQHLTVPKADQHLLNQCSDLLPLIVTGSRQISFPANPFFRRVLADKILLLLHAEEFQSSVYVSRMQQPSFGWHHPQLQQLLFPDHFFH